ncbi:MAG: hypothetical protein ABI367_03490 [Mucilaginibacter sp.]
MYLKHTTYKSILLILVVVFALPFLAVAGGFKFKLKNTSKATVTVFYKISKKSGDFKLKSLARLLAGEETTKSVSVNKGDTIAFYGQNPEDETSAIVKKDYESLSKNQVMLIPIVIPEKDNANFETLENLSLQLEHNKVLNFLLKMDSSAANNFALLENNFQNVYPLGTFIFVDTKTNRLLLPPLEPSFWNNKENYLTIQDSLSTMVNTQNGVRGGAQVAYFLGKLCAQFSNTNSVQLNFKGKVSLIRWKPGPTANIYQVFDDNSVKSFLQNCYAQIDNPDQQYQRYRLYFLSSYERIDNLDIYGKKLYSFGSQTDLSISSNPGFKLFSSNLGLVYAKNTDMSNFYSVQNAVLRTKAYDFTALLFNGFKNNVKARIVADAYAHQRQVKDAILGEYENLINYNPNAAHLSLARLTRADSSYSLTPIITTIENLTPYNYMVPDTAKTDVALTYNENITGYNNKVKLFNAHLQQINSLIKQLDQINNDITKLAQAKTDQYGSTNKGSPGLLTEIEVSNTIVRKE